MAEALELICQGLWFTRAWILEEYNSAGEHTITLLRCRPESTGMSSSEADFYDIQMTTRELREMMGKVESLLARARGLEEPVKDWIQYAVKHFEDICPRRRTIRNLPNPEGRRTWSMSKALHHLRERKNFRIADRIAILGNVCNYEIRIDTNAAEEKAFSLSTCVLAMVDMNADVSLMGRLINAGPQSSFMGRPYWTTPDAPGIPVHRRGLGSTETVHPKSSILAGGFDRAPVWNGISTLGLTTPLVSRR